MHELLKQNQKIWDLFTRKEEYYQNNLDEHGRFLYDESDLEKAFEPEVSIYLVDQGMKIEYPENKTFAVCLTR